MNEAVARRVSLLITCLATLAREHDDAMTETLMSLLDHPGGTDDEMQVASFLARLPFRIGGLGLRSAERLAPAAYWASWADCLQMIRERSPDLAREIQ